MTERDIAKYAAMVAAGVITTDALTEMIDDDSIVTQILAASVAGVAVGVAAPVIEDVVDVAADALDAINPFSW